MPLKSAEFQRVRVRALNVAKEKYSWEIGGGTFLELRGEWRPGEQPVYVSDIRKVKNELGWKPKTEIGEGVRKLFDWVSANKELFQD